jgi:transposase InsO family protein
MSIENLCGLLGYSKQAYYKRIKTKEKEEIEEAVILSLIKEKRKIWKKGSGRNLHASLKEELSAHKIKIGRDKFFEVMRRNKLLNSRKRYKTRTTYSYHHFHKYPNLIKGLEVVKPNQVIVSDITYIWLRESERFCYLYLITDMYSRKILGYWLSEDLQASSALKALKMALSNMSSIKDCIHHSDRGIQYCSYQYTTFLKKNEIFISMTENGDPLENAIAERINRTIKEEFSDQRHLSFKNISEGRYKISEWIKFYNEERPHRSIEMLTPSKAYHLKGELKRMWKNYYGKNYSIDQLADR